MRRLSTHRQRLHIQDEEVEGERQEDGAQQPDVHPGGHADQRLVLRQAGDGTQTEWSAMDAIRDHTTTNYINFFFLHTN